MSQHISRQRRIFETCKGVLVRTLVIGLVAVVLHAQTTSHVYAGKTNTTTQEVVEDFSLKDIQGREHSLNEYRDSRLIVAYFTGAECPLARLYGARMEELHQQYADQGVTVLGICSNVQDSIAELAASARKHQLSFPLLKDNRNQVADLFGATRTPEVVVLDQNRTIRYRGRIDGPARREPARSARDGRSQPRGE